MGDVEAALAFVARRQGSPRLPQAQWALVLSLDLGWMAPGQATAFVARAVQAGLLVAEGEALRLAIDPRGVEVPPRFRPDPEAQPEPRAAQEPFVAWLDRLARQAGIGRAEALQRVGALQERMAGLLTAEAAVLWLAREAGLDVQEAARALMPGPGSAAPPAPAGPP